MKNKVYIVSGALLASLGLLACGGGGDKPTPVTEKGIKISLKDPSASFIFGDSISKDDLVVSMIYSDGSSKKLDNDKYVAYDYNIYTGYVEVPFPIPLEYSYGSTSKTIKIHTTDKANYSSIKIENIEKSYQFHYGSEGKITVKYDDPTNFDFTNTLLASGAENVKYKSTKEDVFKVDSSTGKVTAFEAIGSFSSGAVISAYVDDIKVDEYVIATFVGDVYEGIEFTDEKKAQRNSSKVTAAEFDPDTDTHKLTFPGIVNNNQIITKIAKEGFKDCVKIKRLEFPGNLTEIGEEAFNGCTGIDNGNRTLDIPYTVNYIGANAFLGTEIPGMFFEDPYNWHYSYLDEATGKYKFGDVDSKYLSDTTIAAKIFTREDLCGATYFKF